MIVLIKISFTQIDFYAIGLVLMISNFFFIIIPVIEVATKYPLDYSLFKNWQRTQNYFIIIPVIW